MTIINQKSISGITSVTFASAGDDLLTFHSNNGTERFRIDNSGNTKITAGIVTTLTVTGNATVGGTLGVTGETTFSTHVNLGDSDRLRLGADNDLQIFHDGSNSYISDQGTGQLQLISAGAAVEIKKNTGEAMGLFKTDGAVELYYDNSKKFETTSYGLQFTDNVKFDNPDTAGRDLTWEADNDALHWEDNTKATFGGGNDLQIYHNGSHSYIADEGTGELNISGSRIQLLNAARSEKALDFVQDGAVDIYYNGSKKFETTSTGVTISGTATAGGLSLGDSEYAYFGASNDLEIYHNGTDSVINDTSRNLLVRASGTGDLWLQSDNQVYFGDIGGNEKFIEANDNGDVKLFYDNSQKLATKSDGIVVTGGIYLDGSGGTGSANKLDDYEEGVHTITTNSNLTAASSSATWAYTKIGRMVMFSGQLSVSSVSGSDTVSISLPFAAANNHTNGVGSQAGGVMHYGVDTGNVGLAYYIPQGSSIIRFYQLNDNAAWGILTNSSLANNDEIYVSVMYYTA